MYNNSTNKQKLTFHGSGSSYFGIHIVNTILCLITFGFYYPWAKVASTKYLYQETEFAGSRFVYHGTGAELFKGFIKAVGIFMFFIALLSIAELSKQPAFIGVATVIFYLSLLVLIPISIHGSMRYNTSRTSWRGIHFGYRGNRGELVKEFLVGAVLTVVTLGIYSSWFTTNLRRYIVNNVRFGNIAFEYTGKGADLFVINLKGFFLTILTLGIYLFWFQKELFNFWINNIQVKQNDRIVKLRSTASGAGFAGLLIVNVLLIICTLGFAAPWVVVRTLKFVFANIELDGEIDTDQILQTEAEYNDATGAEVADLLDVELI